MRTVNLNPHIRDICFGEACIADVQAKPVPGWQSQFPRFTHSLNWIDPEAQSHSLTIKTDDANELFSLLKAVKHVIRASREKSRAAQSRDAGGSDTPQVEDTQPCPVHNIEMPRRWSKRTGSHYFAHKMSDGSFCYGGARLSDSSGEILAVKEFRLIS